MLKAVVHEGVNLENKYYMVKYNQINKAAKHKVGFSLNLKFEPQLFEMVLIPNGLIHNN